MIMGALKLLNLLSFGRLSFIAVSQALGGLHNKKVTGRQTPFLAELVQRVG
jgi:hypothetical protein